MRVQPYSSDQEDALQEVANIAMGQAGSVLAEMLGAYVRLSVPRVHIVSAAEVANRVREMIVATDDGDPGAVTATRQGFFSQLRGESIVIFGANGCNDLADLLGHERLPPQDEVDVELLTEVSNLLSGAVLNGLGEQLGTDFLFSPPTVMATRQPLHRLMNPQTLGWEYALLVEVHFSLEERDFACHLVLLMPEDSIEHMRQMLDAMLEDL